MKGDVLDLGARTRVVNLHPGYLPWNRGSDPNLWSWIDNTPKGVTIHYVDEGVDTGDLIAQRLVEFEAHETLASSYQRLQVEMVKLFVEHWQSIRARVPAPGALSSGLRRAIALPTGSASRIC